MKYLVWLLLTALGGSAQTAASLNVREAPFLARGDGTTDDTAAFQKALDAAAAAGGGAVFAPAGKYLIATHLRVPPNCTLMGIGRAPQSYDPKEPRTTLLAVEGAGREDGAPFLALAGPNATLEGVTVFYPGQKIAAEPVAYPWTVRGSGDNVSVINVLLVNPYRALDLATAAAGRHYVRGLYGQPLREGVAVDQCYDIGRIKEVHFWPFWTQDKRIVDYTTNHATGFTFRRTDWEVVEDIFVWGYQTGVRFAASKHGAMNGQMSNVNLDNVDIGLDVEATLALCGALRQSEHRQRRRRQAPHRGMGPRRGYCRDRDSGRQLLGAIAARAGVGEPGHGVDRRLARGRVERGRAAGHGGGPRPGHPAR